ncbi:MAG: hypothetical protein ACLQVX_23985 [Limisphaerales bacterium]
MNWKSARMIIGMAAVLAVASVIGAANRTPTTVMSLEGNDWKVAADRLLLNLVSNAAEGAKGPSAPMSGDFETVIRELGY